MKFLFHVFCFVLLESNAGVGETSNAFIFSLTDFEELAPFVSKVKKDRTKQAIERSSVDGPRFGQDLLIFFNAPSGRRSFTDFGHYYSVPTLVMAKLANLGWYQRIFLPDEVEVFYLDPSR